MATLRPYKCSNCALQATVAGGKSATISGQSHTYYCIDCEELFDKQLSYALFSDDFGDTGGCSICGSTNILRWSCDKPCPRCGATIGLDYVDGLTFVAKAD